mgnify:CR=1 FL=1
MRLRLYFTDGAGSDVFGVDHLILVPESAIATTPSKISQAEAGFSTFIASTTETTKNISHDLTMETVQEGATTGTKTPAPGGSLSNKNIYMKPGKNNLLVWPSTVLIDRTDAATTAHVISHAATVSVIPKPQYELSR